MTVCGAVESTHVFTKTVPWPCMAAAPLAVCAFGRFFSSKNLRSEKSTLLSVKWTDAPESTIHSMKFDLELSLQSAQSKTKSQCILAARYLSNDLPMSKLIEARVGSVSKAPLCEQEGTPHFPWGLHRHHGHQTSTCRAGDPLSPRHVL